MNSRKVTGIIAITEGPSDTTLIPIIIAARLKNLVNNELKKDVRCYKLYSFVGGRNAKLENVGVILEILNKVALAEAMAVDVRRNGVVCEVDSGKKSFVVISSLEAFKLTMILEGKVIKGFNGVMIALENIAKGSDEDLKKIEDKIEKMIENASVAVFAGSVPNKEAAEIIRSGIEKGNRLDKITVLDTYGEHLEKCLSAAPMIVHNNIDEVRKSLNLPLKSEEEIADFLKSVYGKGVKIAALTDGENPAYAMKFGYLYKIYPPEITEADSTGSGDSFLAGLIYGLETDLVFTAILNIAAALGSANASKLSVASVEKAEMNSLLNSVKIEELGDKMKVIDDSPRY